MSVGGNEGVVAVRGGHSLRLLSVAVVVFLGFATGRVLGLFEEVCYFVAESGEFLLDDFPDFFVSEFWVSVDENDAEADDVSVIGYLGSDVWVVGCESGHGFADDDE